VLEDKKLFLEGVGCGYEDRDCYSHFDNMWEVILRIKLTTEKGSA
jgi:hypothetical protein